jgi:putative transposase
MAIKKELVDELLKDADPKAVFSSEGLLSEIKKALAERMLNAELDQHLQGESACRRLATTVTATARRRC